MGLCQHDEPDRRRNREQESQSHGFGEFVTKSVHLIGDHQPRQQWQCDRAERNAEQPQRQLHEPKRDRQPEDRSVAKRRCEYRIDENVELRGAGRDHRRTHQQQNGLYTGVAPAHIRAKTIADAGEPRKLHK